jgi:hypothetical protein
VAGSRNRSPRASKAIRGEERKWEMRVLRFFGAEERLADRGAEGKKKERSFLSFLSVHDTSIYEVRFPSSPRPPRVFVLG